MIPKKGGLHTLKVEKGFKAGPGQYLSLHERKKELIVRDPLAMKYAEESRAVLDTRSPDWLLHHTQQEAILLELCAKWQISIAGFGFDGSRDSLEILPESYECVQDARNKEHIVLVNGKFRFFSFKKDNSIFCPHHKIPIIIDPSILTLNDARKVKSAT